jgi:predicted XRE-type DNA-binding protein
MPQRKPARKRMPSVVDKRWLGREIARIIEDRGLTQTEASYVIKDAPSQISLVNTGKLDGFSSERLIRMLTRLGRDVEIQISKASGKTGKVRLVSR